MAAEYEKPSPVAHSRCHDPIFCFPLPLSLSGYLISLAAIMLIGFIDRALEPERMLPAYYLALGPAMPPVFEATRLQAVVPAFAPRATRDRKTFRYSLLPDFV